MLLYTLCLFTVIWITSTDGHELTKSAPPNRCTSIPSRHDAHVELHCVIPDNTQWKFKLVQVWAEKHSVKHMNVYVKCGINGSVILRQPVKSRGLMALYIDTCKIRHFYRYDLSRKLQRMPFTLKTMEITDSIHVITYRELHDLYTKISEKVNSMYPCYIPPSLEHYVERNVSVNTIKDRHNVDTDARRRHHENIPVCNYTQLTYYEKSSSTKNKFNFISKFLNKGLVPSLQMLNLSSLYLDRTPDKLRVDSFSEDFPSLFLVDLSYNSLTDIVFGPFHGTQKHFSIDMSGNEIRVINATVLTILRSMYPGEIMLFGNPFSCKCDQHDLLQFLKDSSDPTVRPYQYLMSETCGTPLKYKGHVLGDIPLDSECHQPDKHSDTIAITIIPIATVTCFISAILMYLFYRKCIVSFRYKRLLHKQKKSKSTKCDKFAYDAFISYSCEDESWVKVMCGRLEGPPYHATLCLHNRHFVPGVGIADNIFEAVESSRHTVVVLSDHFLTSQWCMMEFREANHKGLVNNKRHLVVILLDDCDKSVTPLPSDVDLFLQTHTYLRVTEYGFWEKLVNVISNNVTSKDTSIDNYHKATEI